MEEEEAITFLILKHEISIHAIFHNTLHSDFHCLKLGCTVLMTPSLHTFFYIDLLAWATENVNNFGNVSATKGQINKSKKSATAKQSNKTDFFHHLKQQHMVGYKRSQRSCDKSTRTLVTDL